MERALLMTSARNREDCLALPAWRPEPIAGCGLVCALCAMLAGCVDTYSPQAGPSDTGREVVASPTPTDPPAPGTAQTSVLIYMKSITEKKYGVLARLVGYRDSSESLTIYEPGKNWWESPALLYEDAPISDPDTAGGADCEVIEGIGGSSNVDVTVALTCHADIALKTLSKADCMKGTIMAKATASASFFDTRWTDVVTVRDKPFVFEIDTCDSSRRIRPIGTERRTIQVSFEAYTRGRARWTPKTEWPATPERADVRAVLYARDAQLVVTGYRYVDSPSTPSQR